MMSLLNNYCKYKKAIHSAFFRLTSVSTGLVASRLMMLITSVLVARNTGVEDFGEFTLFITFFLIAADVSNSIDNTFIRFANKHSKCKSDEYVYLGTAVYAKLIYASVLTLFVVMASTLVKGFVDDVGHITDVMVWGVGAGVIYSVFLTLAAKYQKDKIFIIVSVLRATLNALVLISVVIALIFFNGVDVSDMVSIYIWVSISLSVMAIYKLTVENKIQWAESYKKISEFYKVAIVIMMSSALTVISSRFDVFFIGAMLDIESVGYYSVAVRMGLVVAILSSASLIILIPNAASAMTSVDKWWKYIYMASFYLLIQFVMAVVVLVYHKEAIVYLFGEQYIKASSVTVIMVLVAMVTSASVPFRALIQHGPKPGDLIWIATVKFISGLVLLFYFINAFGMIGASYAMLVVALLISFFMCWLAFKRCMPTKTAVN